MKTCSIKPADVQKKWYIVDAKGQTVGRLASQLAHVLRGKHKPEFTPYFDCGDNIIVINAKQVAFTGDKWNKKIYHNHSGYIGGIKSIAAKDLLERKPTEILMKAVKGMLPKNKLADQIILNLRVYEADIHPHAGQSPEALPQRTLGL